MFKNLNHNESVFSFCSSELQCKGTHPSSVSKVGVTASPRAAQDLRRMLWSHRELQKPASQHPQMHSWWLSQANLLRKERGRTKIQKKISTAHGKVSATQPEDGFQAMSTPSLETCHYLYHTLLWKRMQISDTQEKTVLGFMLLSAFPWRGWVSQMCWLKGAGPQQKATPPCKVHCHRHVPHTDICSMLCGKTGSSLQMGADPK